MKRCSVSLLMLLKRSILDSNMELYAKYNAVLKMMADNIPEKNDIEKAAPYENLFQTNFCLK